MYVFRRRDKSCQLHVWWLVTYKNFSSLNRNLPSHPTPHNCPLTILKCPLSVLWRCPSYREFRYSKMTEKRPGPALGVRLIEVSVLQRCPSYRGVRLTEVSVMRELTVHLRNMQSENAPLSPIFWLVKYLIHGAFFSKVYFCANWPHAKTFSLESNEEKFLKLGIIKDQKCRDAINQINCNMSHMLRDTRKFVQWASLG